MITFEPEMLESRSKAQKTQVLGLGQFGDTISAASCFGDVRYRQW